MADSDSKSSSSKESFPYRSDYYHLIKGKTISRRGRWWTAVLLVQSVTDANKRVVIIQRWQKRNRADPDAEGKMASYWAAAKSFTLNSSKPWANLKETVEEWLSTNDWS
jgi:hypothetical protein